MEFKDKLKYLRNNAKLSQAQLAKLAGVSNRTLQNYELGESKPRNLEIVTSLAKCLNTTGEYLMGLDGLYVIDAHEKGGDRDAMEVEKLVTEISALFAGGSLDRASLDGAMKALNDAYWIAKAKNE